MTDCNYWPQYSPNGGVQWLQLKPWTFSIGKCVQYGIGALLWPSKWLANMVSFCQFFFRATLFAAGAIWSEYLPNSSVQWFLSKPWTYAIRRCTWCCTGASTRPSKWQASEVDSIFINDFGINLTVENSLSNN